MNRLIELANLGQAVWLDYIRRDLITSGELRELVAGGLRGMTSNPTIFQKAISGSADYDGAIERLAALGKTAAEVYEEIVIEDIRSACDLLRPVYNSTGAADGYVSLEVDPGLAKDSGGTIEEARRLFAAVDRPNLMIKVPATPEGVPAIETLTAEGINVNATLMFSLASYEKVACAYIAGVEQYIASGGDPSRIASVASFFVSRVDTAVDRELEKAGAKELMGTIAVANARVVYARFKQIFAGSQWEPMAAKGASVQRPLWASTGTKNPSYSDVLYVDNLIAPHTVNTIPPATLDAFLDHGATALTLEPGIEDARAKLAKLADLGIDLDSITHRLLEDGVKAFADSFNSLMSVIAEKREKLAAGREICSFALDRNGDAVEAAAVALKSDDVMRRIWARDHSVWRPDPAEIENRLGWLDAPQAMAGALGPIDDLVEGVRRDGYTQALLLGMGGSSLAPEVFRKSFGVREGHLDLAVHDTTDPDALHARINALDPAKCLIIVSSKSGTTVEPLSLFKFFHNAVASAVGEDKAGAHFIAITDPGSALAALAENMRFREVFLNDPNVGGRYSALTHFGLVPAALVGADIRRLLDSAMTMSCRCGGCGCPVKADNAGSRLGAALGALAKAGRDKLTLVVSPPVAALGDWVEQLIAESTGKEGRGILPVVGEKLGSPAAYGDDRLFVHIRLRDDDTYDGAVGALRDAGAPVTVLHMDDAYDLGAQFFLWEMATAVAGRILDIHPFDQPNVEAAKVLAREMVAEYKRSGALPDDAPALLSAESLREFMDQARPGDYAALQAYVNPTVETDEALQSLRLALRGKYRLATTTGYGPRFLHSTGQLHKGDAGNGLFVQFTCENREDAAIPDEAGAEDSSMSFGVLEMAQALGDRKALQRAGRRVIRFHLNENPAAGIKRLAEELS